MYGSTLMTRLDKLLCLIDKEKRMLHFSGARNGIILFSNGEIKRHDADLYSVGGSFSNKSKEMKREFKSAEIHLNEDDWVFMYTDGYYDQLGGDKTTSLGMENFENILKGTRLVTDLTKEDLTGFAVKEDTGIFTNIFANCQLLLVQIWILVK